MSSSSDFQRESIHRFITTATLEQWLTFLFWQALFLAALIALGLWRKRGEKKEVD